MSSEKPKTYTIYGKQGHLYRTEIKANSDKEYIWFDTAPCEIDFVAS